MKSSTSQAILPLGIMLGMFTLAGDLVEDGKSYMVTKACCYEPGVTAI